MMAPNPFFPGRCTAKMADVYHLDKNKGGSPFTVESAGSSSFLYHTRNRIHERFDYIKKKKK